MDTLDIKTITPAERRRNRFIPEGHTPLGELVAIRELLTLGRSAEACLRLDLWLDRNHSAWRGGSPEKE